MSKVPSLSASAFGAPLTFDVGAKPSSITAGDFNRDGKLDLVTANRGSATVTILLGLGDGSFGPGTNFAVGAGLGIRALEFRTLDRCFGGKCPLIAVDLA